MKVFEKHWPRFIVAHKNVKINPRMSKLQVEITILQNGM